MSQESILKIRLSTLTTQREVIVDRFQELEFIPEQPLAELIQLNCQLNFVKQQLSLIELKREEFAYQLHSTGSASLRLY